MDFDTVANIFAWLIVILVIGAIGYGVYWFFFLHEHIETQVEATVVGLTSQSVGGGLFSGGGSRSLCIFETDEDERYYSDGTCYFVVNDRVHLLFHDGVHKYERLLEPSK